MKKRILIYIVIALVVIGTIASSVYYFQNQENNTSSKAQTKDTVVSVSKDVTYKGKAGITALALLEQNAKIVTSGTGENAFVTTINDVMANPKNQYWQFSVNGKSATIGAGSYVTQDSDTITWKLASF